MIRNGESGFSLVEVLLAAVLTVGIIGAVFGLMNQNQRMFVTESSVTEMNQSVRTAVDFLTRDVQSAGVGLPRGTGNYAAIFYTNGASGGTDSLLMVNGDLYAPVADLVPQVGSSSTFNLLVPTGLNITGVGAGQTFTYNDPSGTAHNIYQTYATDPSYYLVYDDVRAMIFALTANAQTTVVGATTQIQLTHATGNTMNNTANFGTTIDQKFSTSIDTGAPNYSNARVAKLANLIAYRINATTKELERTEDLTNWYAIARGITDLQVKYRVLSRVAGVISESILDAPTARANIRSMIFTLKAETPDIDSAEKTYRKTVMTFEVSPRNLNLTNNNNLSATSPDQDS